jgi:hypothetical protein
MKMHGEYKVKFLNVCTLHHGNKFSVDGRIILKLIFKKWDGIAWLGLIWLRIGTGGGLL